MMMLMIMWTMRRMRKEDEEDKDEDVEVQKEELFFLVRCIYESMTLDDNMIPARFHVELFCAPHIDPQRFQFLFSF